jgi:hypothetical protein
MAVKKMGFTGAVVWSLILGSLLIWSIEASKAKKATPEVPRKVGEGDPALSAKGMCRYSVPQVMNDPSSVELEPSDTWVAEDAGDGLWRVTLGLRARNAFNALTYGTFVCTVRDEGENWRLVSVDPA